MFLHQKQVRFVHSKKTKKYELAERKIHCVWDDWGKWYISPEGLVFRCCWTGGHYYDEQNETILLSS